MKTNKKRALVSSLLVAATTLSLCVSASATELRGASTTSPYKPVVTLSSSSVSEVKNALRTTKDIQGNSLGQFINIRETNRLPPFLWMIMTSSAQHFLSATMMCMF